MKIKITRCYGVGKEYSNLLPNTEHEVLEVHNYGVEVQGVGKPVRLFPIEYITI